VYAHLCTIASQANPVVAESAQRTKHQLRATASLTQRAVPVAARVHFRESGESACVLRVAGARLLVSCMLKLGSGRRTGLRPVLDLESSDAIEVLDVVAHERQAERHRVSRNQCVEIANGCAAGYQLTGKLSELHATCFIKGQYRDIAGERADELMKLARLSPFGSVPELGERDGADRELGWSMGHDTLAHVTMTAQGEAHTIGVEHESNGHSKGSLSFAARRADGRSISSDHAPRHARKSLDHSSEGSRITRRPTR
jgi:hypothetical protein